MGMKTSVIKNLNPVPTLNWQFGVTGNPWVNGDTVNAQHNSIVFLHAESADVITIGLPDITAESVGKRIGVINLLNFKEVPGNVVLLPGINDLLESVSILDFPDGFVASNNLDKCHFWLESDGVSRWAFIYPDSGVSNVLAYTP